MLRRLAWRKSTFFVREMTLPLSAQAKNRWGGGALYEASCGYRLV